MKSLLLLLFILICVTSCGLDYGSAQRNYIISQSQEELPIGVQDEGVTQ